MRLSPTLLLLAALATQSLGQSQPFSGRVVSITDGDTLRVLVSDREIVVRLHGIDAPEQSQAFGNASRKWLSDQVFGKTVRVEFRDTGKDRYGRTIGEVFLEDKSINHASVKAGMSWWFQRYAATDRKLRDLENEARTARRGLWQDANPIPPWEFRARS